MEEAQRDQFREHGFIVFSDVLTATELERARTALNVGVDSTRRLMGTTHIRGLDPNEASVRVNCLPAIDPFFIELLMRPDAVATVEALLGPHFLISNFSANIALVGSGSMKLHSDQALVVPEPWLQPWAMNVIWCLDDVHEANGATRYLPGSHKFKTLAELPENAMDQTVAFEAPAGSFIAMDGRLWHTSGRNVTDGQRRMMFAYYSSDFVRPQLNWAFALPPEVQAGMDARTRHLFGLEGLGNARLGMDMTLLDEASEMSLTHQSG